MATTSSRGGMPACTILDWIQVTVADGQMTDMGTPFLSGWFTKYEGLRLPGTPTPMARWTGRARTVQLPGRLRDRDNTEIDRMSIATTDPTGYYVLEKAYPMKPWMILKPTMTATTPPVSPNRWRTSQATTVLGNGNVDVGVLPIPRPAARVDWGVKALRCDRRPRHAQRRYRRHGELRHHPQRTQPARYAAVEPWRPAGIPGVTVNLYVPVPCGTNAGLLPVMPATSTNWLRTALAQGTLINTTETERWEQPIECVARDATWRSAALGQWQPGRCRPMAAATRRSPAGAVSRRRSGDASAGRLCAA